MHTIDGAFGAETDQQIQLTISHDVWVLFTHVVR